MKLTHRFVTRCIDRQALLDGCSKLNTYDARLRKQAKQYAADADTEERQQELEGEYIGWGNEIFAQALIEAMGMDKRVGITEYKPTEEDDDTGVDGVGKGINGKIATVQVKGRHATHTLSANKDHLSNFTSSSVLRYGVDPNDTENMLIISTAKDLHHFTAQNMFRNKVRLLNREKLRVLVDGNVAFWNAFRAAWEEAMPKPEPSIG